MSGATRSIAAGVPGYFGSWAVLMALVFISLAVIQRHVPRSVSGGEPSTAPVIAKLIDPGIRRRCVSASVRTRGVPAMQSLAPVFQLAVPRPGHLQADQRQHAADDTGRRSNPACSAAARRRGVRSLDLCLQHRQLLIELGPGPAHFCAEDSRFAIHSEFSFSVVTVCSGNGVKRSELPAA